MRAMAAFLATFVGLVLAQAATAQITLSPFVGHWVGSRHCSDGDSPIDLDIEQSSDGGMTISMKAAGVGKIGGGTINGDSITLTWTNFLSRVEFVGRFTSAQQIEGTYRESITGNSCPWTATNESPPSQSQTITATADTPKAAPNAPATEMAAATPKASQEVQPEAPPRARTQSEIWKEHADLDRQKLNEHLGADAKNLAIKQFCEYAPDQTVCAARVGSAYDFLAESALATLAIASKNMAASLPSNDPANGLPSYYDVYQIYMFLTHDSAP